MTSQPTADQPTVERTRIESGSYMLTVDLGEGRRRVYFVKKTDEMNPSARGGAYRSVWMIRFNGSRLTSDTLAGADANAITFARRYYRLEA